MNVLFENENLSNLSVFLRLFQRTTEPQNNEAIKAIFK